MTKTSVPRNLAAAVTAALLAATVTTAAAPSAAAATVPGCSSTGDSMSRGKSPGPGRTHPDGPERW
ncbi:hypothetical protein [Streptomyces sp. NPDC056660]|uniref:hypothetical protein n=1 Tax=Streptomyces sp. NPDC056660 TaxID=3345897 RepID=UPI0036853774